MIESERIRKEVKAALEVAYQKLNTAATELDVLDYEDAGKVRAVRKQVLNLLNVELNSI